MALMIGMPTNLQKLTSANLSILIVIYAASSAMLHQVWFGLRDVSTNLLTGFGAMFIGDLSGTLIIIYAIKFSLATAALLKKNKRKLIVTQLITLFQ